MKRLILLLIIASCSIPHVLFAQSLTIWGEIYSPLSYKENGKRAGMVTEIVEYLIEESSVQVEKWFIAPWARALKETKKNPNTLLYSVTRTPEREDLFHWIGPVSDRNIYLYKLKSRTDIVINSWEDVKKYSVISLRDGASKENLVSHGVIPHEAATITRNVEMLIGGRIDLTDILDYSLVFLAKKQGVPSSSFEKAWLADGSLKFYLALNKNTPPEIVSALRKSFNKMNKNGKLKEIQDKYLINN